MGPPPERLATAQEAARSATPGDLAAIAQLVGELAEELTPMRGGSIWSVKEARAVPLGERDLGRDDVLVVVGTVDEVVVGFGVATIETLHDGRRLGVITELFVHPDGRGVGVGEAMLELLVGFLARSHCVGIDAMALPGHRAAKNFFEQNGFVARRIVMHSSVTETAGEPEAPAEAADG